MKKNRVIQVTNLSKRYKLGSGNIDQDVNALKGITFEAFEGDKIGLIGLNGSGKSTLLKVLSGHIKPSGGQAVLFKTVQSLSHFDSLLHPDLSGMENIELQLKILQVNCDKLEAAIEEVVAFSELEDFIHRPVKTYSSGMMLRLSFSIFKTVKPEILLLDEVFSAGDMTFRRKSDALMKRHLNEIPLMIMASHELQEIAKYCNRCIVLNKGEIDFDGTVDDAIQQYVERNERKPEKSIAESKALELLSIEINSPEGKLLISDEIRVSIVFHKRIEDDIDLVVYVRNNYGQVLTDCEIYRPDYVRTIERIGQYELSFSIPKHVLNVGHYFVDLAFGNGAEDVLSIEGAIKFEIIPDEWEKDKLWNQNPLVPTRPHLKWSKRLIE